MCEIFSVDVTVPRRILLELKSWIVNAWPDKRNVWLYIHFLFSSYFFGQSLCMYRYPSISIYQPVCFHMFLSLSFSFTFLSVCLWGHQSIYHLFIYLFLSDEKDQGLKLKIRGNANASNCIKCSLQQSISQGSKCVKKEQPFSGGVKEK